MFNPVSSVKFAAAFVHDNLTTNIIQVMICYIGGFLCLISIYLQPISHVEESMLRDSLRSVAYKNSSVATLALVVPVLFDCLTDLLFNSKEGKQISDKTVIKEGFLNNLEKVLFLSGIAVLPITAFFPESTLNWTFIYICCNKCQQIFVFGSVMISLGRYDNTSWTKKITFTSVIALSSGNAILAFIINDLRYGQSLHSNLNIVAYILIFSAYLIAIFSVYRWYKGPFRKMYSLLSKKAQERSELMFPLVYITMTLLCIITLGILKSLYFTLQDYDEYALLVNNLIYLVYVLFITFLSMRMVKSEVVHGLYALIESKKSYVRYISHELRTPLNAVFLGLKLLTEDIQASTDPKDVDRNDILCDANSACKSAIDILNDLLCFDKLESGVLVLHKQEVPVLPFIFECVAMFSSQARECGVNLSVINVDPAVYCDSTLLQTDIAVMDKFKMDQVLRNLISNAVKFTPRGGTVTVSAAFVANEVPVNDFTENRDSLNSVKNDVSMIMGVWNCWVHLWTTAIRIHATDKYPTDLEAGNFSNIKNNRANIKKIVREDDKEDDDGEKNTEDCSSSGKLVIVVADSGAGLSEGNQQRLFKEVVQFNPEVLQAGGGSGLGLWITNMIVGMHGGEINVYSAGEGLGCSFTVEIEMQRKARSPPPDTDLLQVQTVTTSRISLEDDKLCEDEYLNAEIMEALEGSIDSISLSPHRLKENNIGASHSISSIETTLTPQDMSQKDLTSYNSRAASNKMSFRTQPTISEKNCNVLVVDDSSLSRKMLCRLLRTSGYVFDEAEDGLIAVEKVKAKMSTVTSRAKKGCYSVILMDFVMPNMDGPTATKAIRDLGYTAPIVGLTGNALDSDISYFMNCGANHVMAKPFDLSLFEEILKKYNENQVGTEIIEKLTDFEE